MRAVQVQELVGPDGLAIVEVPEPKAGDGILIDVEAAGVSFADLLMSQGLYQVRDPLPFIPGMDVAGTVREAPQDSGFGAGDRVCASTSATFAEVTVGEPGHVFHLPDSLSFVEGAALTVNYQTALYALQNRAALGSGESLLVFGAGGGVGTSAIQVARGLGASKILGLVSTEEKKRMALDAGADEVVLISAGWKDEIRRLTGGRGVDLVYDPVGGDLFLDGLRCLAPGGRLLVIGFAAGAIPEVRVNRLLLNNISVVGSAWGEAERMDPTLTARLHERLVPLIDDGFIRPPIGATFPLEEAAAAYQTLADRTATGKIVIVVGATDERNAPSAAPTAT